MTDYRKGEKRDDAGRFATGTAAGPGRPKGSTGDATELGKRLKSILAEHALEPDCEGKARIVGVLDTLAVDDPGAYVAAVTKILPKEIRSELVSPHLDTRALVPFVPARERFQG